MSERQTVLVAGVDTVLSAVPYIDASDGPQREALDVYISRVKRIGLLDVQQEQEMARTIEAGRYAASLLSLRDPETREAAAESLEEGLMRRQQVLIESREPAKTPKTHLSPTLSTSYSKLNLAGHNNRHRGKIKNAPHEPEVETSDGRSETIQALTEIAIGLNDQDVQDMQEIIKLGDKAFSHFWQANLRLVLKVANRYREKGVPFFELIQVGNLGLNRAIEKFDYKTGYKFSTYATWWVRAAMTRAIENHTKERSGVVSLNGPVGEGNSGELGDFIVSSGNDNAVSAHEQSRLRDVIGQALSVLSEPDADIIRRRYGLPPYGEPQTHQAIADVYGVVRTAITRKEKRILRKLSQSLSYGCF